MTHITVPTESPGEEQPDDAAVFEAIDHLRHSVHQSFRAHRRAAHGDSFAHNALTLLALMATAAVTVIPAGFDFWTRLVAGVATVLVALLRSLDFGDRWRWHRAMDVGYDDISERIDRVMMFPRSKRFEALDQLYDDLKVLREKESAIPGIGNYGSLGGK